jgi:hypothetical protein
LPGVPWERLGDALFRLGYAVAALQQPGVSRPTRDRAAVPRAYPAVAPAERAVRVSFPVRDFAGQEIGTGRVLHRVGYTGGPAGRVVWRCLCACGAEEDKTSQAIRASLRDGSSVRCTPCNLAFRRTAARSAERRRRLERRTT